MTDQGETRLEKTLRANDVGSSGSHQAGFHVPKSLVPYFPSLDEASKNPDCWLTVTTDDGSAENWRYIHYNNKVVEGGTRDEYRVTHCAPYLARVGAEAGDTLVLIVDRNRQTVRALIEHGAEHEHAGEGRLVLSTAGSWRRVSI